MQFNNEVTRSVAEAARKIMAGETNQEPQNLNEELKGDQHKLDANKNNKIDAHDFELLRKKKKVEEEVEQKKNNIPFTPTTVKKSVKNSDGTVQGPMSRARELAQQGMKKVMNKEEVELTESHFKVGDKVRCKESGMTGEVVKLDKDHGADDEKYYTVKKEDGKMVKFAPNELSMVNEELEEGMKTQVAPGRTRNIGTHGRAKGADFGGTDWDKEESGKDDKPKRAKYGSRQNFVRSRRVNESFTDLLETYNQGGIKNLFKTLQTEIDEEVDNETFTAELKDQISSMKGLKKQPKVAKASVQAVKVEEEVENIDDINGVHIHTFENLEEREQIDEDARETSKRAKELADNLRKKDPEKSKMYRSLSIKAHARANNPTGVRSGHLQGMGNKALRRQGGEPVPSSMRGPFEEEFELDLEDYTLEEIEDFMMSEDFEQLNELSKDTVKNYMGAATASRTKASQMRKGAVRRTMDPEADQSEVDDAHKDYMSNTKVMRKRALGLKQAQSRLNKEDNHSEEDKDMKKNISSFKAKYATKQDKKDD